MNIQELEKQLLEAEENFQRAELDDELKRIMKEYKGKDEVISFEQQKELIGKQKKSLSFLTGIPTLDRIMNGFQEGELTIITAPTGQGKTTFCQSLTRNFSDKKIRSLWFSYEVLPQQFLEKFGENIPLGYTPKTLTSKNLTWLERKIVEAIAKFEVKVIFIDHLHFLFDFSKVNMNMSLWIGDIMRQLKLLTLKYNISIFLIVHLTKTKFEEKPGLDDIRDSSFITQEADNVLVMWRKVESGKRGKLGRNDDFQFTNQAIVSVEKNRRTGQLGTFKLILKDNLFQELDERISE